MIKNVAYKYFTPNELKPEGWLKKQLEIEAEGLVGNLDKIWPDIRDSMWIGGEKDGWERVPYWLDGFIPLAYLLDNEDMKKRAKYYIYGIVERQREDGWICPCTDGERHNYDTWAALLICKVLAVYADCANDTVVEDALYKALYQFSRHIDGATLHNWGATRWFEGLVPIFWLYEKRPEDWMILLAKKLDVQGFDWEKVFSFGMLSELTENWDYISHVVNLGMMLKSRSLMSRVTGEDPDSFAKKALSWLYENHGMATGHFTGDENLSGTSPIQGSELCSVVEAMYSFETLFSVSGDTYWLDMLEREAFNALPATVSPDMWTHQYVQLTNQVECSRLEKRVFRTNNEEAHIFGLEPNFGCCTANMGQGFPKFALSAFAKTEKGFASTVPLPSVLTTEIDGTKVVCRVETDYPFRENIRYVLTVEKSAEFEFALRVPSFAKRAVLDGEEVAVGKIHKLSRVWEGESVIDLKLEFESHFEKRPEGLVCLYRGPLLYSLPIKERWEMHEYETYGVERKFPYCDYYVYPESKWNYGFASEAFEVEECDFDAPFTPEKPPVKIKIALSEIEWSKPDGRCARIPDSRKALGKEEVKELIPYGCTNLRMTEMPFVE